MSVLLYVNETGSLATSYSDDEHRYGQHTQKYDQHTRNMVNIPEVWKGKKEEKKKE